MRHNFTCRSLTIISAAAATLLCAVGAMGQASQRTIFVANNGNLEGAVTGFTIDS